MNPRLNTLSRALSECHSDEQRAALTRVFDAGVPHEEIAWYRAWETAAFGPPQLLVGGRSVWVDGSGWRDGADAILTAAGAAV